MGQEPENLVEIEIEKRMLNDHFISRIKIDLDHINFGKDGKRRGVKARSNYTAKDIVEIVSILKEQYLVSEETEEYEYFNTNIEAEDGKLYRLVFLLKKDERDCLGIITFYRIKEKKRGFK